MDSFRVICCLVVVAPFFICVCPLGILHHSFSVKVQYILILWNKNFCIKLLQVRSAFKFKMSLGSAEKSAIENNPYRFSWQQTMLRIKDPTITIPFYENHFGLKLIHKYDFPQWKFSLYFLAVFPEEEPFELTPGTPESEAYLWNMNGTCLELTHNHGSETDSNFKVIIIFFTK